MEDKTKNTLQYIVFFAGLVLIVGGIITAKHGATVLGIIVVGVNIQHIFARKRRHSSL